MLSLSASIVVPFFEERPKGDNRIIEVLTTPQKQPAHHILHNFKGFFIKRVHKRQVICGLLGLLLFPQ